MKPEIHSDIRHGDSLSLTKVFQLTFILLFITIKGIGQVADFSANITMVCSGSEIIFTDNSSGTSETTIYQWDFGTGSSPATTTGIGPHTVIYTGSGTSSVSLTITEGVSDIETKTDYITVTALPAIPDVLVADNCDGTSTLSTTATGTLLWSTTETASSIIVSVADNYTVTSTADGCVSLPGSGTATPKTTPETPVVTVIDDCNGISTLSTTAEGSLLWSTAETSSSIIVTASGVYTVATTINGCTSLSGSGTAAPKTTPATPEVSVMDNCNGTSILSTTSAGTLLWSTMQTSSSIIVAVAGVYTVTATINGCISLPGSGTASPKISPESPVAEVDCHLGYREGIINIVSPLGEGLEYRLNGGSYQSATSFTNVKNGSFTITVRNPSGCTTTGEYFEVSCGCVNGATVTLSSTSGTTCNLTPVTVSDNTFGGSALWVFITEDGDGSVSPAVSFSSPFTFTYTPRNGDTGKTVKITVTTNNPDGSPCVAAKETYMLSVNTNPSAPAIGMITQPSCTLPAGSVVLTGLPANGAWILTRTPGGVTTTGSGVSSTISDLLAGTYTFTVTNESGCVSGSSDNVVIAVQPITPAPPIVSTITHPTCSVSTGSVILNGLPAGTWTINPGGITGSTTSKTISALATGTHFFTVSNSDGCTSIASAEVVINAQPVIPSPPSAGEITSPSCTLSTGSVVLNGLAATGSWTLTRYPGTITTSGTGTSVVISGLPAGTYNFTITNNAGCLSVPSANIIIPAQPVIPSVPEISTITFPTCSLATGSVILSGLPPTDTWTLTRNPDVILITGSGISKKLTDIPAGTYSFTVTNSAGCISGASSEVLIPVQPSTPVLIITNPGELCTPQKADMTAAAITEGSTPGLAYTYWTNSAATIPYLTPSEAGAGIYYTKGTSASGCYVIKPVSVIITTLPAANAGKGGNECDLTFIFSGVAGTGTGTWTKTTGPGSVIFTPDAKSPVATVTVSEYGTYNFTREETNGTCSNSSTITVNFYEQPVVNAGSGGNNCGSEFYLNAVLYTGTGIWVKVTGPGTASFSPDANSASALVKVSAVGTYTFRWTVTNGTCSKSEIITVNFIQQLPAIAGTDGSECDRDFIMNATATTGTGTWAKISGPGNATFIPDNHQPNAKVTVDMVGSYVFEWVILNSNCTSRDLITVVFEDPPTINAGPDIIICKGNEIELNAAGTGSFVWSPAEFVSNPFIASPVISAPVTTTFRVTLTDQSGCKNTDDIIVEVRENPVARSGPDQILQNQFATEMNAELNHDYENGIWSLLSGSGKIADVTYSFTAVSGLSFSENSFLWTVSNGVCPLTSDTVLIKVQDLVIPSLMTPNMDGRNDYFILAGLKNMGKTELVIFDRRGVRVYKSVNYDNSWNGVDYNGNPLPDDTYFYVIRSANGNSSGGYIVIRR